MRTMTDTAAKAAEAALERLEDHQGHGHTPTRVDADACIAVARAALALVLTDTRTIPAQDPEAEGPPCPISGCVLRRHSDDIPHRDQRSAPRRTAKLDLSTLAGYNRYMHDSAWYEESTLGWLAEASRSENAGEPARADRLIAGAAIHAQLFHAALDREDLQRSHAEPTIIPDPTRRCDYRGVEGDRCTRSIHPAGIAHEWARP